jgi:hypothetical protein
MGIRIERILDKANSMFEPKGRVPAPGGANAHFRCGKLTMLEKNFGAARNNCF